MNIIKSPSKIFEGFSTNILLFQFIGNQLTMSSYKLYFLPIWWGSVNISSVSSVNYLSIVLNIVFYFHIQLQLFSFL